MPFSPAAFRRWVRRLAVGLLLPLSITAATLVLPPAPRVSLKLPDGQFVVAVSPDGSTLATYDGVRDEFFPQPGTIRLWDLRTGRQGPPLEDADDLWAYAQFSPDGRVFCGAGSPRTYKTWSVADGKQLGRLADDLDVITPHDPIFSPDSRFVLLERKEGGASKTEQIELWDVALQEARATMPGQERNAQWAADGRRLATYRYKEGGRINRVALYELAAEDLTAGPVAEHAVAAEGIAFSADLGTFATVNWPAGREAEAALTLRDLCTGAVLAGGLPGEPSWRMWRLELDRERHRLTVFWVDPDPDPFEARYRLTRRAYDLDSGEATRQQRYWPAGGEFSPDYHWFAEKLPFDQRAFELWDTDSGEDRGLLRHDGDGWWDFIGPVSFTRDSQFLLISGLRRETVGGVSVDFHSSSGSPVRLTRKGAVVGRLWDLEARREVCAYDGCARAYFSKDDKTLVAVGSDRGEIKVWDVPARQSWRMSLAAGTATWALLLLGGWAVRRLWRRLGAPRPV
jgi:WD40 repeat protein